MELGGAETLLDEILEDPIGGAPALTAVEPELDEAIDEIEGAAAVELEAEAAAALTAESTEEPTIDAAAAQAAHDGAVLDEVGAAADLHEAIQAAYATAGTSHAAVKASASATRQEAPCAARWRWLPCRTRSPATPTSATTRPTSWSAPIRSPTGGLKREGGEVMAFIHNTTAAGRESIEATGDDAGFNPLLSSIFVDGAHGQPGR